VNALQKTLVIIAFLVLAIQAIHLSYQLWLKAGKSVLDKYDEPLKREITGAKSLEELWRRYDPVRQAADQAREERRKKGDTGLDDKDVEPYKSENALHNAISDWEFKSRETRELRIYWLIGLVILFAGLASYKQVNRWFGLMLLILAFAVMIYWTSGTSNGFSWYHLREYDRLLINKFVFSLISIALLFVVIWYCGIFAENKEAPAQ
jgi:hypothetical protein